MMCISSSDETNKQQTVESQNIYSHMFRLSKIISSTSSVNTLVEDRRQSLSKSETIRGHPERKPKSIPPTNQQQNPSTAQTKSITDTNHQSTNVCSNKRPNNASTSLFSRKITSVRTAPESVIQKWISAGGMNANMWIRKVVVDLVIRPDCIQEIEDGPIIHEIPSGSAAFALLPSKNGKFRFLIKNTAKNEEPRVFEVDTREELNLYYAKVRNLRSTHQMEQRAISTIHQELSTTKYSTDDSKSPEEEEEEEKKGPQVVTRHENGFKLPGENLVEPPQDSSKLHLVYLSDAIESALKATERSIVKCRENRDAIEGLIRKTTEREMELDGILFYSLTKLKEGRQ